MTDDPTREKKYKPLTSAQICALISARNTGDPTRHLSGRAEMGGWERTRIVLMRRGLIDRFGKITGDGHLVVDAFEASNRNRVSQ